MLQLVDVFSGCGGMTRGFVDARLGGVSGRLFEPVLAVEHDPSAADTYAANFGPHVDRRPIQEIPNSDFPAADVLIGGPPCQGFSALNRNRHGDGRRQLWQEYARALDASNAGFFVMENVPQLLKSEEYAHFKAAAEADGWHVSDGVLLAANYGVPQARRRAIAVGSRFRRVALPEPSHGDPRAPRQLGQPLLPPWRTVADAIGHLPPIPDGKNWHRGRNPTAVSMTRYRHVPPGGNRFDMQRSLDAAGLGHLVPDCWRRKTHGTTDVFGRMLWNRPAPTIRTEFYKPEKGRYLHPIEHRAITIREGALLMGFPDDFVFPEDQSLTDAGRQIGNAVPPPLAQRIAEVLAEEALAFGLIADHTRAA
jgi:DNA (cytosine-5)-methyltransferase 1